MSSPITKPLIGISCTSMETASGQAIIKRVSEAGGVPLVIQNHEDRRMEDDFSAMHGLVVMGNDLDIDPETYVHRYPEGDSRRSIHPSTQNEKNCPQARARAEYENRIMRLALSRRMPMLCVCGGMQRLNVLCGGTLHQHVPDLTGNDLLMQRQRGVAGHVPTIPVVIEPATKLAIIAKKLRMQFVKSTIPGLPKVVMENSFRHQSIDMVGEGLRVCAMSDVIRMPDGTSRYLIEAVEPTPEGAYGKQFLIGVQWHPEFCASDIGRALVKELVRSASGYAL